MFFLRTGMTRTKFPKRVYDPAGMKRVIGLGENNKKLGKVVTKGRLKGYKIIALTLEERATCPSSCFHWNTCYGNNMQWAYRVDHTSADFLPRVEAELAEHCASGRGILLRLHILGDFFSIDYVRFWQRMLDTYENLVIWAYTAREPISLIGQELARVRFQHPDRFWLRYSNGGLDKWSTVSIKHGDAIPAGAFICPEQTGQADGCASCGACWATSKNLALYEH